jgi:hypothetical protein
MLDSTIEKTRREDLRKRAVKSEKPLLTRSVCEGAKAVLASWRSRSSVGGHPSVWL